MTPLKVDKCLKIETVGIEMGIEKSSFKNDVREDSDKEMKEIQNSTEDLGTIH